ncbi:hypothetical protein [Thermococcus sp. GR6]|uniref:hypothetical protein n=1 Tax=Thermococcus sp. GR6 TaxID=1638256 RepID=UPI0014311BD5|nr:hypothetical protein [Thermococcus sp. GR6]NJE41641.1 hypothetical protein [Thermococcus sp. GR6]
MRRILTAEDVKETKRSWIIALALIISAPFIANHTPKDIKQYARLAFPYVVIINPIVAGWFAGRKIRRRHDKHDFPDRRGPPR